MPKTNVAPEPQQKPALKTPITIDDLARRFASLDSDAEIAQFCTLNFGVTFPIFKKVEVNGAGADPVWRWLKANAPGLLGSEAIKWNFTKFLIGRDGKILRRFDSDVEPDSRELVKAIEAALAVK